MGTNIANTIVAVYNLRMLALPLGMRCGNLLKVRNNGKCYYYQQVLFKVRPISTTKNYVSQINDKF